MSNTSVSILLLASSPYATRGALYDTVRRHCRKDDARVLVWKASTEDMNVSVNQAIIQEAYDEDPEAARKDCGAEFRDDLADAVTREAMDAVTMRAAGRGTAIGTGRVLNGVL